MKNYIYKLLKLTGTMTLSTFESKMHRKRLERSPHYGEGNKSGIDKTLRNGR